LFLGEQLRYGILENLPYMFDHQVRPQLFLYPPIAVLIVDTMHLVAAKLDGSML
jgi:hypothetical protein